MENQSWINFRLDAITRVVDASTKAVKADHKAISAALFPGPSMARKMVRQDWGEWTLDAYYPMIYNKFYYGLMFVRENIAQLVGQALGVAYPGIDVGVRMSVYPIVYAAIGDKFPHRSLRLWQQH